MASESPPPQIELGRVVLGSGEYRIVYLPVGPSHLPTPLLVNETGQGGGGDCSAKLEWALGDNFMTMDGTGLDILGGFHPQRQSYRVFGEVAAEFQRVFLICRNGTQ